MPAAGGNDAPEGAPASNAGGLPSPAWHRASLDPVVGESTDAASSRRRLAWPAPLRSWIGEELAGEEAEAFAAEAVDRDLRRLRALAPLMVVVHVAHILLYRVAGGMRAAVDPGILRWQDHVVAIHAATLPLALLILFVAWRRPGGAVGRRLLPLAALVYLVHGALATGVDQIVLDNVAAFTGYCFGVAVICAFALGTAVWVYGAGFLVVALAISHFQADPAVRISNLLNAGTVVTMSMALGVLLAGARRRDFRQRRIIARQRDELAGLNSDLERRVDEQVAEIVRRAEEVSRLNAQLRSQIRARSSELQAALARLAAQREEDGNLRAGDVLAERFEIRATLGAGAMGIVYAGRDRVTGADVAIKVIRPGSAVEMEAMRRFLGEASAVASITHPAVVRMIHVDISGDGLLYQAQELIEGSTLDEHLHDGPWPQVAAARLGAVLCDALAAAHEHGVIHRDVKPSNVMLLTEAPGLKLLDFGLAKLYDEVTRDAKDGTGSRFVVGTPAYMSPEQVLGSDVSGKTDVYAAGVLLFQVLAGRGAFDSDGASNVMMRHVTAEAPDLRAVQADVDAELAQLVAACLSKNPGDRPTAGELGDRLREFADRAGAPALEAVVRGRAAGSSGEASKRAVSGSIARRFQGLGSALFVLGERLG